MLLDLGFLVWTDLVVCYCGVGVGLCFKFGVVVCWMELLFDLGLVVAVDWLGFVVSGDCLAVGAY